MDKNIKVSIITVSYNAVKTIEKTILSVIEQSYENIEYIVIDGGSTDGTVEIIKKYEDKIAYWISESDKGIYDAMNKGIEKASGTIVGIINSDDWYEKIAVETVVKHYKEGEYIYHGGLRSVNENGNSFVRLASQNVSRLKRGMVVNHPAMFVNKKVYDLYGGFSLEYKVAADWDFTLKAYLKKVQFIRIEEVLANFRIGGVSSGLSHKHLKELHQIRKHRMVVGMIDIYYIYDSLRLLLFGKKLYQLYLLKNRLFNGK